MSLSVLLPYPILYHISDRLCEKIVSPPKLFFTPLRGTFSRLAAGRSAAPLAPACSPQKIRRALVIVFCPVSAAPQSSPFANVAFRGVFIALLFAVIASRPKSLSSPSLTARGPQAPVFLVSFLRAHFPATSRGEQPVAKRGRRGLRGGKCRG